MERKTIIVEHKYIEGNYYHCFDDKNYQLLTLERDVYTNENQRQKEVINGMIENEEKYLLEINRLKSIINEVRELIKRDLSTNETNNLIYSELLDIIGEENK